MREKARQPTVLSSRGAVSAADVPDREGALCAVARRKGNPGRTATQFVANNLVSFMLKALFNWG